MSELSGTGGPKEKDEKEPLIESPPPPRLIVPPTLDRARTVVRGLLHVSTKAELEKREAADRQEIEGGKYKPKEGPNRADAGPAPLVRGPRIALPPGASCSVPDLAEFLVTQPAIPRDREGMGWHLLWAMHALPTADYPLHNRALPAFYAVAGAFSKPGSHGVDLRALRHQLQLFAESCRRPDVRQSALELLQKSGLLRVIPEVHWRVDREHFLQHLGFPQEEYMRDFGHPSKPRVWLELGAGNGAAASRRRKAAHRYNWADFSVDDCAYFSLSGMLRQLIDFERLEAESMANLTEEQRLHFCDVLYKILVIRHGETASARFAYDEEVQGALNDDVDSLVEILARKAPLLPGTSVVPDVISKRDAEGQVYYPHKIFRMTDGAFDTVCNVFARKPETYLKSTRGLLRYVPLRIPGKAFADFDELDRLQDGSADLVIARRSTVYKRGEDYVRYLATITRKLSGDGLLLDDGFRDNDGWRYRFVELMRALHEMDEGVQVQVILGPPFPGEDYLQGRKAKVPLGIAASRDAAKFEWLAAHFPRDESDRPLFELRDPLELCGNPLYLRTLDENGGVVREVDAELARLGSALE